MSCEDRKVPSPSSIETGLEDLDRLKISDLGKDIDALQKLINSSTTFSLDDLDENSGGKRVGVSDTSGTGTGTSGTGTGTSGTGTGTSGTGTSTSSSSTSDSTDDVNINDIINLLSVNLGFEEWLLLNKLTGVTDPDDIKKLKEEFIKATRGKGSNSITLSSGVTYTGDDGETTTTSSTIGLITGDDDSTGTTSTDTNNDDVVDDEDTYDTATESKYKNKTLPVEVQNKMNGMWKLVKWGIDLNPAIKSNLETFAKGAAKVQLLLALGIILLELYKFLIVSFADPLKTAIIFVLDQVIDFINGLRKIGVYTFFIYPGKLNSVPESETSGLGLDFNPIDNYSGDSKTLISLRELIPTGVAILENQIDQHKEEKAAIEEMISKGPDEYINYVIRNEDQLVDNAKKIKNLSELSKTVEAKARAQLKIKKIDENIKLKTKELEKFDKSIPKLSVKQAISVYLTSLKSNHPDVPQFNSNQEAGGIVIVASAKTKNIINLITALSNLTSLFAIFMSDPRDFMKAWKTMKEALDDIQNIEEVKNPDNRSKYDDLWESARLFDLLPEIEAYLSDDKKATKTVGLDKSLLDLELLLRGFKSSFEDGSQKALDANIKVITQRVKKLTEISKAITGVIKAIELINNNSKDIVDMRGLIVPPQPGGLELLQKNLKDKSLLNRPDEEEPFCMLLSFVGGGPGIATIYNLLFAGNGKSPKMNGDVFSKDSVSAIRTLAGLETDGTDKKTRMNKHFGYDSDLIDKKKREATTQITTILHILSGNMAIVEKDPEMKKFATNLLSNTDTGKSLYD